MIRNYFLTAIRSLLASRAHSVINVAGLALGFSGVLLIVLWIQHERSFDRTHAAANRIYRVLTVYTPSDGATETYTVGSGTVANNIREHLSGAETVTQVITGDRWPNTLCFKRDKDTQETCIYHNGIYTDDSFFKTFSFPIVKGLPAPLGAAMSIAVSRSMSETLFPGEDPIGKHILIDNRHELTIAGIFENVPVNSSLQFDFALPFAVYQKLRGTNDEAMNNAYTDIYVKTFTPQDEAALSDILNASDIRPKADADNGVKLAVQALTDIRLYDKFENGKAVGGRIVYIRMFDLIGAVVLIMACINFINLATARSVTRSKEIGVRKVIGAGRLHLVLQFMGESFILVLIAFFASLVIVQTALPAFGVLIGESLSLNLLSWPMPFYMALILISVSILAGLYPALIMSGFNPVRALKTRFTQPGYANVLRKSLMVVQVSVSVVLIIFAGVLFLQLDMIRNTNLGFDRQHIIHVEPTFPLVKKFEVFRSELLRHPNVEAAAMSFGSLLNMTVSVNNVQWPGSNPDESISFYAMQCGYNFIETFGIRIKEGRSFERQDSAAVQYVILTESAVKKMGLSDPVGTHITISDGDAQVVGVAKDLHGHSLHHAIEPVIFVLSPGTQNMNGIYVRYSGDAQQALQALKETYGNFEKDFPMIYSFFDESFDKQYKTEATTGTLTIVFTLVAIGIALLGILGLSTYTILRRLREVGVRKVFGASAMQIVVMLSKDFTNLALVSSVIATPIGYYLAHRWLAGFAYRVSIPWWLFGASFLAVLVLTLVTVGSQSLHAARTNPSRILKDD